MRRVRLIPVLAATFFVGDALAEHPHPGPEDPWSYQSAPDPDSRVEIVPVEPWSPDRLDGPRPDAQPPGARSELEARILDEMNELRSDPRAYAARLRRMRPYYDGAYLRLPGEPTIITREGVAALDEAIAVLVRARPLSTLTASPGLARAARDHAEDLGATGALGHRGSDGSEPHDRAARHGKWHVVVAENITFGASHAAEVVIDLLVDDGVPDRGHRDVLLSPDLRVAGVACEAHPSYRLTCVIDYAGGFTDHPTARSARRAPRIVRPRPDVRPLPGPRPMRDVRRPARPERWETPDGPIIEL